MTLGYNYSECDVFGHTQDIQARTTPTIEKIALVFRRLKKDRCNSFSVAYIQCDGVYHNFYYDSIDDMYADRLTHETVTSYYDKDKEIISHSKAKKFVVNLVNQDRG